MEIQKVPKTRQNPLVGNCKPVALLDDWRRITSKPEVVRSCAGLVTTNALVFTD
jgi:hypothetical protein